MALTLMEIATCLREMEREGAVVDMPEGSRFVRISDTLAHDMADAIERSVRRDQSLLMGA